MRAEFGLQRGFKQVYGSPSPGQYAMEAQEQKQCHWDHCREQFAPKWDGPTDGFYFSHGAGESENVAGFICKTEEILTLIDRSGYSKTDRDTILWVRPSPFWSCCEIRRSLFTILLRCGRLYNPERDNYEDSLYGKSDSVPQAQEYVNATDLAVKRFLFGFTKYVKLPGLVDPSSYYYKTGWVAIFKNKDLATIRQMLVLPEGEERLQTVIGLDAVWA